MGVFGGVFGRNAKKQRQEQQLQEAKRLQEELIKEQMKALGLDNGSEELEREKVIQEHFVQEATSASSSVPEQPTAAEKTALHPSSPKSLSPRNLSRGINNNIFDEKITNDSSKSKTGINDVNNGIVNGGISPDELSRQKRREEVRQKTAWYEEYIRDQLAEHDGNLSLLSKDDAVALGLFDKQQKLSRLKRLFGRRKVDVEPQLTDDELNQLMVLADRCKQAQSEEAELRIMLEQMENNLEVDMDRLYHLELLSRQREGETLDEEELDDLDIFEEKKQDKEILSELLQRMENESLEDTDKLQLEQLTLLERKRNGDESMTVEELRQAEILEMRREDARLNKKDYNKLLSLKERGERVDHDRFTLLGLLDRRRRGVELVESEVEILDQYFALREKEYLERIESTMDFEGDNKLDGQADDTEELIEEVTESLPCAFEGQEDAQVKEKECHSDSFVYKEEPHSDDEGMNSESFQDKMESNSTTEQNEICPDINEKECHSDSFLYKEEPHSDVEGKNSETFQDKMESNSAAKQNEICTDINESQLCGIQQECGDDVKGGSDSGKVDENPKILAEEDNDETKSTSTSFDKVSLKEFQDYLKEQGLPLAVYFSQGGDDMSVVTFSDETYIKDLIYQKENRESERKEECLAEAYHLYKHVIKKKKLAESEELLLSMFAKTLREKNKEMQKADEQFDMLVEKEVSLHELKKQESQNERVEEIVILKDEQKRNESPKQQNIDIDSANEIISEGEIASEDICSPDALERSPRNTANVDEAFEKEHQQSSKRNWGMGLFKRSVNNDIEDDSVSKLSKRTIEMQTEPTELIPVSIESEVACMPQEEDTAYLSTKSQEEKNTENLISISFHDQRNAEIPTDNEEVNSHFQESKDEVSTNKCTDKATNDDSSSKISELPSKQIQNSEVDAEHLNSYDIGNSVDDGLHVGALAINESNNDAHIETHTGLLQNGTNLYEKMSEDVKTASSEESINMGEKLEEGRVDKKSNHPSSTFASGDDCTSAEIKIVQQVLPPHPGMTVEGQEMESTEMFIKENRPHHSIEVSTQTRNNHKSHDVEKQTLLHEGEGSIEPNVEAKDQVIPRIFDRNIIDAHQEDDINQQKSWSSNLQHPKEIKKVDFQQSTQHLKIGSEKRAEGIGEDREVTNYEDQNECEASLKKCETNPSKSNNIDSDLDCRLDPNRNLDQCDAHPSRIESEELLLITEESTKTPTINHSTMRKLERLASRRSQRKFERMASKRSIRQQKEHNSNNLKEQSIDDDDSIYKRELLGRQRAGQRLDKKEFQWLQILMKKGRNEELCEEDLNELEIMRNQRNETEVDFVNTKKLLEIELRRKHKEERRQQKEERREQRRKEREKRKKAKMMRRKKQSILRDDTGRLHTAQTGSNEITDTKIPNATKTEIQIIGSPPLQPPHLEDNLKEEPKMGVFGGVFGRNTKKQRQEQQLQEAKRLQEELIKQQMLALGFGNEAEELEREKVMQEQLVQETIEKKKGTSIDGSSYDSWESHETFSSEESQESDASSWSSSLDSSSNSSHMEEMIEISEYKEQSMIEDSHAVAEKEKELSKTSILEATSELSNAESNVIGSSQALNVSNCEIPNTTTDGENNNILSNHLNQSSEEQFLHHSADSREMEKKEERQSSSGGTKNTPKRGTLGLHFKKKKKKRTKHGDDVSLGTLQLSKTLKDSFVQNRTLSQSGVVAAMKARDRPWIINDKIDKSIHSDSDPSEKNLDDVSRSEKSISETDPLLSITFHPSLVSRISEGDDEEENDYVSSVDSNTEGDTEIDVEQLSHSNAEETDSLGNSFISIGDEVYDLGLQEYENIESRLDRKLKDKQAEFDLTWDTVVADKNVVAQINQRLRERQRALEAKREKRKEKKEKDLQIVPRLFLFEGEKRGKNGRKRKKKNKSTKKLNRTLTKEFRLAMKEVFDCNSDSEEDYGLETSENYQSDDSKAEDDKDFLITAFSSHDRSVDDDCSDPLIYNENATAFIEESKDSDEESDKFDGEYLKRLKARSMPSDVKRMLSGRNMLKSQKFKSNKNLTSNRDKSTNSDSSDDQSIASDIDGHHKGNRRPKRKKTGEIVSDSVDPAEVYIRELEKQKEGGKFTISSLRKEMEGMRGKSNSSFGDFDSNFDNIGQSQLRPTKVKLPKPTKASLGKGVESLERQRPKLASVKSLRSLGTTFSDQGLLTGRPTRGKSPQGLRGGPATIAEDGDNDKGGEKLRKGSIHDNDYNVNKFSAENPDPATANAILPNIKLFGTLKKTFSTKKPTQFENRDGGGLLNAAQNEEFDTSESRVGIETDTSYDNVAPFGRKDPLPLPTQGQHDDRKYGRAQNRFDKMNMKSVLKKFKMPGNIGNRKFGGGIMMNDDG